MPDHQNCYAPGPFSVPAFRAVAGKNGASRARGGRDREVALQNSSGESGRNHEKA